MKPKAPKRKASKPKKAKKSVRKAKRAKKITKKMQTGSMRQVWNGSKLYTKGGLMKKDLIVNKNKRVMSKKAHASGKKLYKSSLKSWNTACSKARKMLKITGFVAMNRGAQGKALYQKAKELYGQ